MGMNQIETERDKPLSYHWKSDTPIADKLGLPVAKTEAAASAREAILTEAFLVGVSGPRWISYSRRHDWWASPARYRAIDGRVTLTYHTVIPTIDELARSGLIEHDKAPAGTALGRQSRFRASFALLRALEADPFEALYDPGETIRLTDADGKLVDYRDTDATERLRRSLRDRNEILKSLRIDLLVPGAVNTRNTIRLGDVMLYPGMQQLHRVFNRRSFKLGGRFYGGWWQPIPKPARAHLLLEGEPTAEVDFPELHPRMLYSLAGRRLDGDAYDVPAYERDLVKRALMILLNADKPQAALRAVAEKIGGKGAFARACAVIAALEEKHALIRQFFGSGAGLTLMRHDSDVAETIMRDMFRQGLPILPIHDSFIVHRRDRERLLEAMAKGLNEFAARTGNSRVSIGAYARNVPHMEGGPSPVPSLSSLPLSLSPADLGHPSVSGARAFDGAGATVLRMAAPIQGDLFEPAKPVVPSDPVFAWTGGPLPEPLRTFIPAELRRRGLTKTKAAKLVGISRPQLVNVMRGRFGASAQVATGIRSLILENAETVRIA